MASDSKIVSSTPTAKNMNSRLFSDSTKKQKKKISKLLLDGFDGFQTKWPPVSETLEKEIRELLIRTFEELKFRILTTKEKKFLKKSEKTPEATEAADLIAAREKSVAILKGEVVFGINEVTRGLEKNLLSLVVVDRSTQPFPMISHIPLLAASRNIPTVAIEGLSSALASKIGVGSLVAFAFKNVSPSFSTLIADISRLLPHIACTRRLFGTEKLRAMDSGIVDVQGEDHSVSDEKSWSLTTSTESFSAAKNNEITPGLYKPLIIKRLTKDDGRAAKLNVRQKKPAPVSESMDSVTRAPGKRKAKMVKIGKRRRDTKPLN